VFLFLLTEPLSQPLISLFLFFQKNHEDSGGGAAAGAAAPPPETKKTRFFFRKKTFSKNFFCLDSENQLSFLK
jgi:hypothetical protein